MLAGLGMVLASCLLLALGRPAAMPAAVVLAAFCTAPAGMLLIVVGAIVLVARHSLRSI